MSLTASQITALRWMRDFPNVTAEWCHNGKRTKRGPEFWNTMKLDGPRGSIVIELADWEALRGLFTGQPLGSGTIYGPNEAGLAALREHREADAKT